MSKFLESKITDCRSRLRDVHKQIDALNLRAASIEGELRAYESMLDSGDVPDVPNRPVSTPFAEKVLTPVRPRKSRLSPPWLAAFKELVSSFPETVSRATIEDIARQHGPITDSFRTALWHHVRRGYIDELDNGLFRANQETAYRAGLPWSGPTEGDSNREKEFDLVGDSQ
jgi:hypothetical protein